MNVFESAFSLVIYKNGHVTEQDIDELLTRYRLTKGIAIEKEVYSQAVEAAKQHYNENEQCLLVCAATTCLKKSFLRASDEAMHKLSSELGCPVEVTGCQYQCAEGPTLTLKTGQTSSLFLGISSAGSWSKAQQSILRLLETSRKAALLKSASPQIVSDALH